MAGRAWYNDLVDFDEFRGRVEQAEKLSAAGRDERAATALGELAQSDLPDLDRAMAWVQAAEALARLGRSEDALAAYARAEALESPHRRFQASFRKGDFLLRLGRKDECRELFNALLERPEATLAERHSFQSRLKLLRRVPDRTPPAS